MAGNVQQGSEGAQMTRLRCIRQAGQLFRFDQPTSLTFCAYTGQLLEEYKETGHFTPMHVQVLKRGQVFCGRVLEATPGAEGSDTDWFFVDSLLGQSWYPHKNVRQCSNLDGRCSCVGAEAPGGARACAGVPGASAVPLGNTGTTVEARA